jgi:hypothetical protein
MPLEPKRWRRPAFGGGAARGGYSAVMAGVTLGDAAMGAGVCPMKSMGVDNRMVKVLGCRISHKSCPAWRKRIGLGWTF